MSTKHTPGPWAVEIMPSGRITVTAGQFFVTGDESANLDLDDAHLIAAAPDLLEALRRAVVVIDGAVFCGHELNATGEADLANARAAIARATGAKP